MLLFNRYEYNPQADLLGKGGFARVYKAKDKKLNRLVALKIYKTSEISDRYSLGSEIQRVINLDHPNISRYLDIDEVTTESAFGEVETIQVCVMELLDGGNIRNFYNHNKDAEMLIRLLTGVLNGLSYLHENDIIHRDIKPGNILIKNTRNGPVAKITDFGISKLSGAESNLDSSSALIVSIPYMAPEQLNSKKFGINGKVSFNIDLWSLGVAVYEIVSGEGDTLFRNSPDDSPEQIMLNIVAPGIPDKIKQLPEPFRSLVENCIVKDARQRVGNAGDLIPILKANPEKNRVTEIVPEPKQLEIIAVDKTDKDDIIQIVNEAPAVSLTADTITQSGENTVVNRQTDFLSPELKTDPDATPLLVQNETPALTAESEQLVNTESTTPPDFTKAFQENNNLFAKPPIAEKPFLATGTDDIQVLHFNKSLADDADAPPDQPEQEQPVEEMNGDETQILRLKKSADDDVDAISNQPKQEQPVEETNGDETQILRLKHSVADDADALSDQTKQEQPVEETNGDETQVLHLKKSVADDADAISDQLGQEQHVEEMNADDTQILPIKKAADVQDKEIIPQSKVAAQMDPDDTRFLQPEKVSSATEDDTQLLEPAPVLNKAIAENMPTDDKKILLERNSTREKKVEETQTESKILLFKRYEYYPNKNLIGRGGFSRVYKAFDKKLQRWVALKIYKTGDFSDRYSPIAEIQRVVNLDHSNICRYLDIEEIEKINPFGESENIQVCVMELLDSGNLAEYYQRKPDIEVFKKLLSDVFMGLSYLHKNGIIHRDIKPANILIKETLDGPIAKITDFGISKKSDAVNNNSSSALVVSIPYMAPEQLNVKNYGINGKISFNLDLWSLGVTIYEVLSGKVLFKNNDADNSEQIMTNIMAAELPDKIKDLDSPFVEIVSRCIVKKASDRAQRVEELISILRNYPIAQSVAGDISKEETPVKNQIAEPEPEKATQDNKSIYQPPPANTGTNAKRNTFYVLENDVKGKNEKKASKKKYLLWSGIAVVVLAGGMLLLFLKQTPETKSGNPQEKASVVAAADTLARRQDSSISGKINPPVRHTDSFQRPVKENIPVISKNDNAVKKEVVKNDRQKIKNETPANKNGTKSTKAGGDNYLLTVTASVDCVVKINGSDYEIKKGGIVKLWLAAGVYQIRAISSADNKEIFSKTIKVNPEDSGNVGHVRIP